LAEKPGKIVPFVKKSVAKTPSPQSKIDISASSVRREPPLTEEALRTVVARVVLYGTLMETGHSARDRSYRNISEDDMLALLEGEWTLEATPEWDEGHRNWKYTLKGTDADGEELVLIVALQIELDRIDIITKF
jgi:hypothetical protein